jgi:hypothetical protein
MDNQKPQPVLNIPTAIVIAGAIIAGAVIWTKGPMVPRNNNTASASESFEQNLKPVTENDHIIGNPNAKIKIIEYSDPSCPFCKVFHNTMNRLMNDYGVGLQSRHPRHCEVVMDSENSH